MKNLILTFDTNRTNHFINNYTSLCFKEMKFLHAPLDDFYKHHN